MKNKLFYQNPYLQSFETKVLSQRSDQEGRNYVLLEETAFYPTGGGQPHDTGTIDGLKVIDVEEVEDEIRHFIEKPLQETSRPITGQIDWERRFDHMQQHAGQHILSAAFEKLFGHRTISFHLGKETLTIDLEIDELTEREAAEAEALANDIILENRPIQVKWVSESELIQYPLRKLPDVSDNIRLVMIPDFDYNGCGGTHPKSTGEVGAIKILDWERQKKKIRVQFVCGKRVLTQLHKKQQIILELTRLLNAPEQEMAAAAGRLLESGKVLEKSLEEAQETMVHFEAKEILDKRELIRDVVFVGQVYHNRSIQELQKLARMLSSHENKIIAVLVAENEDRLQFVAAKGMEIDRSMKELAQNLFPLVNGKGGGNNSMAQGGGGALINGEQLILHAKECLMQ